MTLKPIAQVPIAIGRYNTHKSFKVLQKLWLTELEVQGVARIAKKYEVVQNFLT